MKILLLLACILAMLSAQTSGTSPDESQPTCYGGCVEPTCISSCLVSAGDERGSAAGVGSSDATRPRSCDECDALWASYWQCVADACENTPPFATLQRGENIVMQSPTELVYTPKEYEFVFQSGALQISATSETWFSLNFTDNSESLKALQNSVNEMSGAISRLHELEERYDALVAYVLNACPNAQLAPLLQ